MLIVSIGVLEVSLSNLDNFDQRVYQPYVVDILVSDFLSHSVVQNEEVKKLIQRGIYVVFGFFFDDFQELREIVTLEVPLDKLFLRYE